ncbi:SGNH/GDSL hydrolase family protein [Prevotella pectinovora]|uniref:SGNH/GDSL hydrolase family protein n=1 Tax=Prevotella pectinovora TaxID=1602169 RepID=UPI00258CA1A9|nr:SGNH/GDSL hydrolase family protein [uncultured Prevotella sp.]
MGTSIPEGCTYPDYSCQSIGAKCINKSIGASFMCAYDVSEKGIEYAGLSLTETIKEKENKYRKYVEEGKLSSGRMNHFINCSFENVVLPYAKWADIIVIDHGYNDDISLYKLYESKNSINDENELWLSTDRSNFIGAFNYLVAEIRKINPNVQIVVGGYFQNTCTIGYAIRGKYVQRVTEDICRHYKLPILDVWNHVGIPDGYKPKSENYIDSINSIYKTDFTKWIPNERGEIPYFQIFCPDKVHPFSDPTGTSDKILNAVVSELFKKRLAETGI